MTLETGVWGKKIKINKYPEICDNIVKLITQVGVLGVVFKILTLAYGTHEGFNLSRLTAF